MRLIPLSWVFEWSQIIGAVGSVVFSGLLAYLYKQQQKQLAADNKALLEVGSVEWENDTATLELSNFGNGVATDLALTTLVHTDEGEHRKYVTQSNHLKRKDKSGTWSNTIQPGEEDITFEGISRVGEPIPASHGLSRNWGPINFSLFMTQMRKRNISKVKYLHVVNGTQLSSERCLTTVNPMVRSIEPKLFKSEHTLENLPAYSEHGSDDTFRPYFEESSVDRFLANLYYRIIRIGNWIPKITVRFRPLDASGNKRVKRVFIRRKVNEWKDD